MKLHFSTLYSRICAYATTSTAQSVYIIGGWTRATSPKTTSTIAKYSNDIWSWKVSSLNERRSSHGAITVNGLTMIIGGWNTEVKGKTT